MSIKSLRNRQIPSNKKLSKQTEKSICVCGILNVTNPALKSYFFYHNQCMNKVYRLRINSTITLILAHINNNNLGSDF